MDHDRLFKELLTTFFSEFIELFLPGVAGFIEPGPLQFLDKEVFTDITSDERHVVDLLVKARFRDRGDAFFLIHVENQSTAQDRFAGRMFRYFSRLHEKFALPIYPVALLSYDQPQRPESDRYQVDFPDMKVLNFVFRTIQLNQLNWRDYVRNPNPIASALMSKMKIDPPDRPYVKLECLRMLLTLKLEPGRRTLISTFMNSYLKLNAAERAVYDQAMAAIEPKEREQVLVYTNEWIEQGKAEGLAAGRREIVIRLLRRRFAVATDAFSTRVNELTEDQLDQMADDILEFQTPADVEQWLAKHR